MPIGDILNGEELLQLKRHLSFWSNALLCDLRDKAKAARNGKFLPIEEVEDNELVVRIILEERDIEEFWRNHVYLDNKIAERRLVRKKPAR